MYFHSHRLPPFRSSSLPIAAEAGGRACTAELIKIKKQTHNIVDVIQIDTDSIIPVHNLFKVKLRGVPQIQAQIESAIGLPPFSHLNHPALLVEVEPLPLLVHVDIDGVERDL